MTSALPRPGGVALLAQWQLQPLALVAALALAAWYLSATRRLPRRWSRGRTSVFVLGLVLFVWTTCGWPQAYHESLYWVWTTQALLLLLIVPLLLLVGHPLRLARAVSGPDSLPDRLLRTRFVRVLGNPLVGPALVPVLSGVLFFGPVPGWAIRADPFGWVLQLALVVAGALVLLPLVGIDDDATSLAVGLSLAIGSFELVLDALPGIILRLHASLVTSYFDHRAHHSWTPAALHDQQIAGAIVWCVSEVIDLPFLLLVYRRWLRADARDAARIDAVLEAERIARASTDPDAAGGAHGPADAPWWLSDAAMRKRLNRPD